MPPYSPLRYPGGKKRLVQTVMHLLELNGLRDFQYVEPFAGGASIALALLFGEYASVIHINDLSRPVYAFWYTALEETDSLCDKVKHAKLTISEWRRQREIYRARDHASLSDLGFASLYLNRTNRSGIIGGGVIGGQQQQGVWPINARFGKPELIRRIRRIGRYKGRIRLYQKDALEFTADLTPEIGDNAFFFYDPPYIETRNKKLYLNDYDLEDHHALAKQVQKLKHPWVVVYDYMAIHHQLYSRQRRMVYGLHYTAQDRFKGREVIFFSDSLQLSSMEHLLGVRMQPSPSISKFRNN
jgi:DNA adenine methylase